MRRLKKIPLLDATLSREGERGRGARGREPPRPGQGRAPCPEYEEGGGQLHGAVTQVEIKAAEVNGGRFCEWADEIMGVVGV
jgi:hypothetical protein